MRKIIQICAIPCAETRYGDPLSRYFNSTLIVALCNDSSVWIKDYSKNGWGKVEDIPQDDYDEIGNFECNCRYVTHSEQQPAYEELKEDDDVYIKGKVEKWYSGEIIDSKGHVKIVTDPHCYLWVNKRWVFKSTPPKNEWISVKDRLPEVGSACCIFFRNGLSAIAKRMLDSMPDGNPVFCRFGMLEPYNFKEITHWKPLDAPPIEHNAGYVPFVNKKCGHLPNYNCGCKQDD